MALNLEGFVNPVDNFEGLNRAAQTLTRTQMLQNRLAYLQQGRQAATSKFVADYLDPKQHLTGTAYDPAVVNGFNSLLQQGQALASKGASTSDILMALGPQVSKLSDYSTKAKLINNQTDEYIKQLSHYSGYNPEALKTEALKEAFYDQNGALKDLSTVDQNRNYVDEAIKNNPLAVTTNKGLEDLVTKTPMQQIDGEMQYAYGGRSRKVQYKSEYPSLFMDIKRDNNGNPVLDKNGYPVGIDVATGPINGDDGKPIIDPTTGQPFTGLDRNRFNAIIANNPDIFNRVRGEVDQYFKQAANSGGTNSKPPMVGSSQWYAMAQHILGEDIKSFGNRSHFSILNDQKETAPAVRVELGGDAGKGAKTNNIQTIGEIFNNNPSFTQGEAKDVNINGQTRSMIDVTSAFQNTGLSSGKGPGEKYKSVYYDPNKRELVAAYVPKGSDAGTQPSYDIIPENMAGRFMARIAGSNNVDPAKVTEILSQLGYQNAKFKNALPNASLNENITNEHTARVNDAIKNENWNQLNGIQVPGGTVQKINDRYIRAFLGAANKYSVDVKGPDGNVTTKYFKDKNALTDFINSGTNAPLSADEVKKKFGIHYQ